MRVIEISAILNLCHTLGIIIKHFEVSFLAEDICYFKHEVVPVSLPSSCRRFYFYHIMWIRNLQSRYLQGVLKRAE